MFKGIAKKTWLQFIIWLIQLFHPREKYEFFMKFSYFLYRNVKRILYRRYNVCENIRSYNNNMFVSSRLFVFETLRTIKNTDVFITTGLQRARGRETERRISLVILAGHNMAGNRLFLIKATMALLVNIN